MMGEPMLAEEHEDNLSVQKHTVATPVKWMSSTDLLHIKNMSDEALS
jgi:hypothetical protein